MWHRSTKRGVVRDAIDGNDVTRYGKHSSGESREGQPTLIIGDTVMGKGR